MEKGNPGKLRHAMQAEASRTLAERGTGALERRTRTGELKRSAFAESLRINLQAVFLASLTTALGFLSMNFSDVPPTRHLGTFVAFGVGVAFVLSVTFLPAVLRCSRCGSGRGGIATTRRW